jgi:hypothetical protein
MTNDLPRAIEREDNGFVEDVVGHGSELEKRG